MSTPFKLTDEQQEALDIIVSCGDWFALKEHIEFLVNQHCGARSRAMETKPMSREVSEMGETITWNSAHGFDCSSCGHSKDPCEHWKIFVAAAPETPASPGLSEEQIISALNATSYKPGDFAPECGSHSSTWVKRFTVAINALLNATHERGSRREGKPMASNASVAVSQPRGKG